MTRHIKVIFWDNHIVFFFLASMKEFQLDVFRQLTRMFPKQKPTKLLKHVGFYKKQSGPSKVRCSICNEYRSDLHITWKKVCVFFMAKAGSSFIDGISPRKKTPLHTSLVIYFNVKKCVDSTKCLWVHDFSDKEKHFLIKNTTFLFKVIQELTVLLIFYIEDRQFQVNFLIFIDSK